MVNAPSCPASSARLAAVTASGTSLPSLMGLATPATGGNQKVTSPFMVAPFASISDL